MLDSKRVVIRVAFVSLLLAAACAAAACTQEDPPYGAPGAIANWSFPGQPATGSSGNTAGDGGPSGTPSMFPAAYNAADPPAPAQPLASIHAGVAAGTNVSPQLQCLAACHGEKAAGSQKKWAVAGWAAASEGSQTGLDKGEVIVVDGAKKLGPVKTAPDGYFWIPIEAGTVGANASTAIRNKDGRESAMVQKLASNGDCNTALSCHTGTAGAVDFKP